MLSGHLEGNVLCIQLPWMYFVLCVHSVNCRDCCFSSIYWNESC